jgi:hypothetical protein
VKLCKTLPGSSVRCPKCKTWSAADGAKLIQWLEIDIEGLPCAASFLFLGEKIYSEYRNNPQGGLIELAASLEEPHESGSLDC